MASKALVEGLQITHGHILKCSRLRRARLGVQPLLGLHKVKSKEGKARFCFPIPCLVAGDFSSGIMFCCHKITPRGRRKCLRKEKVHGLCFAIQARVIVALKLLNVLCLSSHESFLERAACESGSLLSLPFLPQFLTPFKCTPVSVPESLTILIHSRTPARASAHVLGYCGHLTSCLKRQVLKTLVSST